MKTFTEQLEALDACEEAIEWVNGRSLRKCWQVADRSDWMLWLVGKLNICETEQHELACDFAERALKYVPKGEDRPRLAIEAKRRWIKGEATDNELAAARAAAWAAWGAAGAAAWAATRAATRAAERKAQCRLIRKRIPVEMIEEAIQ